MPAWTPIKCLKNQESPSGFHKGFTVEYTAVVCVTQAMTQQPARRARRKAPDSLLEAEGPVPSYQHNSVQRNALSCLPCPLPAIHTPGIPTVPCDKPVVGPEQTGATGAPLPSCDEVIMEGQKGSRTRERVGMAGKSAASLPGCSKLAFGTRGREARNRKQKGKIELGPQGTIEAQYKYAE